MREDNIDNDPKPIKKNLLCEDIVGNKTVKTYFCRDLLNIAPHQMYYFRTIVLSNDGTILDVSKYKSFSLALVGHHDMIVKYNIDVDQIDIHKLQHRAK